MRSIPTAGLCGFAAAAAVMLLTEPAAAASQRDLDAAGKAALQQLFDSRPETRQIGAKARAVLVFPEVVRAGFLIGGQAGDGVLLRGGAPAGYYRLTAAAYGLQAGAQTYAYAIFFMTEDALAYLHRSDGWAVGSAPTFVAIDRGQARVMNTNTMTQEVYVVIFGQKGLMAGLGLEGSKITQIFPSP